MDPNQTLLDAEAEYEEGNYDQTLSRLSDYAIWRFSGGFQPDNGDNRWRDLMDKVAEQMEWYLTR